MGAELRLGGRRGGKRGFDPREGGGGGGDGCGILYSFSPFLVERPGEVKRRVDERARLIYEHGQIDRWMDGCCFDKAGIHSTT